MSHDTPLTDDYVASLLSRDAKAISSRAAAGLTGGISKRPTNAARPNTRFLRNIIRDTDAHNSALLAREAEESRARLQSLQPDRKRKRPEQQVYSVRARRDDTQPRQRRRHDTAERKRGGDKHSRARLRELNADGSKSSRRRSRSPRADSRSRDPKTSKSSHTQHGQRSSRTSKSHDGRRSRSPLLHDRKTPTDSAPSVRSIRCRSPALSPTRPSSSSSTSSFGPLPLSTNAPRGRAGGSSTIDARFSVSYDPALDVGLDEHDAQDDMQDWDQALEALRDRAKWKVNGAERLRAAGFSEAEVGRWDAAKSGGGTGEEAGVKWKGVGEGREWDRGKDGVS